MTRKGTYGWLPEVCRIVVGAVFVFSGVAKGIDPWGTALKVREYLTAFGLEALAGWSTALAVAQCVAETALGGMLLCRVRMKLTALLMLVLMGFFTLLTLVIAIWNPLDDCGCFGSALKIDNWTTFAKNVVLLAATIVVWRTWRREHFFFPFSVREAALTALFALCAGALIGYCWRNLPILDNGLYAAGTDLRRDVLCSSCMGRSMTLVYEDLQNGGERKFALTDTTWYDTTRWRYVATRSPYDSLPERARKYDFALWRGGYDRADEVVFADGVTYLMLVRDRTRWRAACRTAMERFAARVGTEARIVWVFGVEEEQNTLDPAMPEGAFGMDRATMAELLRADAGVVRLADGVVTDKRSCARLDKWMNHKTRR